MKIVAFFSNRSRVGATSLVYHLTWMYKDLGVAMLAVDLDPQADLTSLFMDEKGLERLWLRPGPPLTISGSLRALWSGIGDATPPYVEPIADRLELLPGDLDLSSAEDELSAQWLNASSTLTAPANSFEPSEDRSQALEILSTIWRLIGDVAEANHSRLALVDVGPNLGAISRAALLSADHIILPLVPELACLRAIKNLGWTLGTWREEWRRHCVSAATGLKLPPGLMAPIGYTILQPPFRLGSSGRFDRRWMSLIPLAYREAFPELLQDGPESVENDPQRLAVVKPYTSLMTLAHEARKPMFHLTPADGAIGGHAQAVRECYSDYRTLALEIATRVGVEVPFGP